MSDPPESQPGVSATPTVLPPLDASQLLADADKTLRAVLTEAVSAGAKQPTRQVQATQVLEILSSRIQTAIASLQVHTVVSATEEIDSLWEKADHAKRELDIIANSLKHTHETSEKASVVDGMRKLESKLKEFTATLPKDKRPLQYDSGKDIRLSPLF